MEDWLNLWVVKMKIGYVLISFPILSETFILNEIIELKKKRHKVTIFSVSSPKENIIQPEIKKFNLLEDVFYLPDKKLVEKIESGLKSLGFFGRDHEVKNLREKILAIIAAKYFVEKAKNLKLDILHAHFNGISVQVAMLMSKKLDIPFTFTAHAFDIFINPNIKVLKKRMKNASAVITPSYYNRDYLYNLTGIDKEKIHVIRACTNIDKFETIKKNKDVTILSGGRLVEKKGIKYGILSVKELIKDFPNIQYNVIGSGPLENELKNLISSLNLENNVKFFGSLDSNSVRNELSRATIFILPCVRAKNGDLDVCPLALQEAMLAKIPVISTNMGSVPELIENGKEGFLVKSRNVKQLVDSIKTLLENKKLRIKMGENGRKKIEKEFNIHKEIEKLLKIWSV